MRCGLLGRLELVNGNGSVTLPGAMSRAIVGRLLLAHGTVVRRDTLIDELWEEREAKDPVNALQVQLAKLRVAFAARGEKARLLFGHGGYRIVLGPEDEVDVPAFEAALREGREHLAAAEYEKAESRLRMLETVREYALTRLREEGWAPAADGSAGISSRDQKKWARRLTEESANIRAAADLMPTRSREPEALLLEARLGYFWFISGREKEGIDRLRRSLRAYDVTAGQRTAEPTEEDEWALFHTIAWLTWLHHVAGHHAEAGSFAARHKAAWQHAKNPDLAVLGLCYDALHAMLNGRDDVADLFAAAEAAVVGTELHWDRAVLQTNWSTYGLQRGDTEGARRHGLIAVAASRAADDDFARVFSLTLCGDADESDGLRARARAQWTEAARILHAVGARTRWAYAVLRLACLDIAEGESALAEQRLADVSRLADEAGADDLRSAVANLRGMLAFHDGRFADAGRIFSGVWSCPGAPSDRRAVSAVGLAVLARFGPPPPAAQDLVQEAVLRAWQNADILDPDAEGIRPWLITVVRNLVIDGYRARKARPPETVVTALHDMPGPEAMDPALTRKLVREALGDLTLQHREILVHVEFLDQSVARTAKALGIPPGTVKSRTHLALKALRAALVERGYTP